MSLKTYFSKRHFRKSPEPSRNQVKKREKKLVFVIQKHAARSLHYDFRLEMGGVLKSWAVPKGPSLNPQDKRLAIMVEDHPYAYKDFEGIIPSGYGAGSVEIWDKGTYTIEGKEKDQTQTLLKKGLKKGEVRFTLEGTKMKGEFVLVRMKGEKNQWLLIKGKEKGHKMPKSPSPMLCTLLEKPFDSKEWIFEIKWDGYRALAEVNGEDVFLYSRNFQSFNARFPDVVEELKRLKIHAIFDGEIVATDKKGVPHFQLLQNASHQLSDIHYHMFDLLFLNGEDLREKPLRMRKKLLQKLLKRSKATHLHYVDHVEEKGKAFFKTAVSHGLEGIIGKEKNSLYESKRSKKWVKIRSNQEQEVVICGFTKPRGGRKGFGSLILGVFKGKTLRFAGHVGTGFDENTLKELKAKLSRLKQKKSPFKKTPQTNEEVTWVKPQMICQVSFKEWTAEGQMRQPVFKGLREDKKAQEVIQEKEAFTHVDKMYFPKEKITKKQVLHYYETIAPYLLPYIKDRPQSLKRFPEGIKGITFFQKNLTHYPEWIETVKIAHATKKVNYLLIQDKESLLYAVNLGCIELHPFLCRTPHLDRPDFLVFDLDPVGVSFETVIEVAQVLHGVLKNCGIESLCKTSASRGLHVLVPLGAKYSFEEAKNFAHLIALHVHQKIPALTSLERSPSKRRKKVYLDYLQNSPHQTIVAPYSLRAKEGAPVSTPLEWKEVKKGLNPRGFTLFNTLKRLKKKGDLLKPLLGKGVSLEKALKKLS